MGKSRQGFEPVRRKTLENSGASFKKRGKNCATIWRPSNLGSVASSKTSSFVQETIRLTINWLIHSILPCSIYFNKLPLDSIYIYIYILQIHTGHWTRPTFGKCESSMLFSCTTHSLFWACFQRNLKILEIGTQQWAENLTFMGSQKSSWRQCFCFYVHSTWQKDSLQMWVNMVPIPCTGFIGRFLYQNIFTSISTDIYQNISVEGPNKSSRSWWENNMTSQQNYHFIHNTLYLKQLNWFLLPSPHSSTTLGRFLRWRPKSYKKYEKLVFSKYWNCSFLPRNFFFHFQKYFLKDLHFVSIIAKNYYELSPEKGETRIKL